MDLCLLQLIHICISEIYHFTLFGLPGNLLRHPLLIGPPTPGAYSLPLWLSPPLKYMTPTITHTRTIRSTMLKRV